MNWGEIFYWTCAYLAGLILLSMAAGVIANAVIKVRKTGSYRAELDAPELSGYGGKITATFDSEKQMIEFLQRYATDVIRWAHSPDRAKQP